MTPGHWVLGDSTGPTQSFTTGLRSPFGPGARHHTGSMDHLHSKKNFLSPRISSLTLLHLHEKDAGQYRFSLLGKLNEPFLSGFPLSYFHILIVMQEEFNCAWLQKFVQSFSSPACWHIFTQPRIFVQIRRRKIILSTLLYLFSFLYIEPSFAFCLI